MRVLTHDDTAEEDGHDPGQVDALGQGIRGVDTAQHEGELQGRIVVQVHVLQHQRAHNAHKGADSRGA